MVTAIQEASRKGKLKGEVASQYSPLSDHYAMFGGISSSGEDLATEAVGYYVVDAGLLFLIDLEDKMFAALAEATFAEDWNSEADSVYDSL
ncbi:MAG: hypothetical protein HYX97_04595 [Chloroflexi bacterium]|nr:hypothetical protein [Chloroflexota bacterium]